MEIVNLLEFTERAQLREWFIANHATTKECWVTMYRTKIPRTDCIHYLDVVEEALCFGWIDSTHKGLPDGRRAQRLTPRRKGSHWTELNKQRCADLEQRGLMTDGAREIRIYTPDKVERFPVQPIETVSTVGAGDNFNAGYIYAKLLGWDHPADRVQMAQRWSQDVCRQLSNNISDELVANLKK